MLEYLYLYRFGKKWSLKIFLSSTNPVWVSLIFVDNFNQLISKIYFLETYKTKNYNTYNFLLQLTFIYTLVNLNSILQITYLESCAFLLTGTASLKYYIMQHISVYFFLIWYLESILNQLLDLHKFKSFHCITKLIFTTVHSNITVFHC